LSASTKVAAKKTAGVLGDDLALNAQQVAGVATHREIPVVWAVANGSALNKLIIVPAALVISALAPWAVVPLLMIGGGYLCFEGVDKVLHRLLHRKERAEQRAHVRALADPAVDILAIERQKIRGAIRTDIILSAEIIVIALGTVAEAPFSRQVGVLSAIAVLMTVGVYGFVAGIVKLDDAGLALNRRSSAIARGLGRAILVAAPYFMKLLSVAGNAARIGRARIDGSRGRGDVGRSVRAVGRRTSSASGRRTAATPIRGLAKRHGPCVCRTAWAKPTSHGGVSCARCRSRRCGSRSRAGGFAWSARPPRRAWIVRGSSPPTSCSWSARVAASSCYTWKSSTSGGRPCRCACSTTPARPTS